MANIKRVFVAGRMNKDLDDRLLADGQYRDALNIDVAHAESDDAGTVRNVQGNTKKGDLSNVTGRVVDSTTRTIGATTDEANNIIYYLVASDEFDGIFEYNENTDTVSRVLQSNKATPTTDSKFAFNKDYFVTGINFIDGFLYWTDNLNEPRRINISRAKSYNIDDDRIDDDIRVIRPAPLNAPIIDMEDWQLDSNDKTFDEYDDGSQENNIEERYVQFAIRYKYKDNQYSALSPFSGIAFVPDTYAIDYGSGENKSMLNQKAKVRVTFETGSQFVEEIELIYRDTKNLNIYVVESFNKVNLGVLDNNVHDFIFSNNKIYRPLPEDQLTRLYDNVPLKAKSQDILGRNLIYGNYEQFYDIVDSNGVPIKIDVGLGHVNRWWVTGEEPLQTFRSDRDYEVGIQYGDNDGRFTTVLTSDNNTAYIEPQYSVTSNSLLATISNNPPDFATNYRLVVKQSKNNYHTIFPILYYVQGMYRYFLINDFDLDKVKVGEYVVFKSNAGGATQKNKRYKVLEVKNKPTNFLSVGSINEVAGLYFKIKVDEQSEFSQGDITIHQKQLKGGNAPSTDPNLFQTQASATSGFQAIPSQEGISFVGPSGTGTSASEWVDDPVHYGEGPEDIINVVQSQFGYGIGGYYNRRVTVEIVNQSDIRFTYNVSGAGPYTTIPGALNNPGQIYTLTGPNESYWVGAPTTWNALEQSVCQIYISPQSYYYEGDKWKINSRTLGTYRTNTFGGICSPDPNGLDGSMGDWGGAVIFPGNGWNDSDSNGHPIDKEIKAGAVIRIQIIKELYNINSQYGIQQFPPSPQTYKNIEEWFYESGAYLEFQQPDLNGNDIGPKGITFQRLWNFEDWIPSFQCTNDRVTVGHQIDPSGTIPNSHRRPVQMIIQGFGTNDSDLTCNFYDKFNSNVITASIDIQQAENLAICETTPEESDIDIFHETTRTYPIENGKHKVTWSYLDFTFPSWATIDGTGYTNLGQLDPENNPNDVANIEPHYFQVGDYIDVVHDTPGTGAYTTSYIVLHVPNKYNVVISQTALGAGPVTAGTIGFRHDQAGEVDQIGLSPAKVLVNHTNKYEIYDSSGSLKTIGGNPALIDISTALPGNPNSTYNAFTFGNGVESNRIRDHFNASVLEYSPRSSTIIENYEKERKEATLIYSGVYKSDSSVNRFNEFNLSIANFKNLDLEFGSIQKLYARNTDLIVFQEDKVTQVLYGKNLLSDSTGGGQIVSIPEVLGTQTPFSGEWGISFNPESFAEWGQKTFWTDARRGVILMMVGDSIQAPISDQGMKDYFRDLFRNDPNTVKWGAYNPRKNHYVLASNDETSRPCSLELTALQTEFSSSGTSGIEIENILPSLIVSSNTSWTTSIVYSTGSGWVSGVPSTGFGDQNIYIGVGDNTGATRTATVTFTYCDGQTADYVITQGSGEDGELIIWVISKAPPVLEP